MRANQIGFLLCRLVAVGMVVWYLPMTFEAIVGYIQTHYQAQASTYMQTIVSGIGLLFLASLVWVAAHRASRWLSDDGDCETTVSIDGAQFAAIGLALLGVAALIYSASGLARLIAFALYPNLQERPWITLVFDVGGNNSPVMAVLGLLLLLFAPRLGIWLENATYRSVESDDVHS